MISDAELLKLVMERYPEQPTPFIIEQFTVLKAGLIQANNKLAAMDMEEPVCEQVIIEEPMPEAAEAAPSAAPKKKFTKRSLVVRPEEAIGDDVVQCCLCGRGFQNLTAKHLLSHGISVDEYKKLCFLRRVRSRSLSAKICWKNCRKTCRRPSGPESRSCPANT